MKIKKFNESGQYIPSNDEDLASCISDTISGWLDMRRVMYGEPDEYEIDPDSVRLAAQKVIEELKRYGVDFDMIYSTNELPLH